MKKIILILLLLNLNNQVYSIEPDVFVQSTVNRASQILSKNISKEEKIDELKNINSLNDYNNLVKDSADMKKWMI